MAYVITDVEISKNPVNTSMAFEIAVLVITWLYLQKNHTWASLKNSGMSWKDLKI